MLFFFSSRRRHTRSLCDWSSDVCSSDLDQLARSNGLTPDQVAAARAALARAERLSGLARRDALAPLATQLNGDSRSEEHTSELQSHSDLVCRLLLEKKKNTQTHMRQQSS